MGQKRPWLFPVNLLDLPRAILSQAWSKERSKIIFEDPGRLAQHLKSVAAISPGKARISKTNDLFSYPQGGILINGKKMHEFRLEGRTLYCAFIGRLGSNQCSQVEDELDKHFSENPQSAVFDVGKVDFLSSTFLRICIRTARRLDGGSLSIINASPFIKDVLKTAGFDRVQEIDVQ